LLGSLVAHAGHHDLTKSKPDPADIPQIPPGKPDPGDIPQIPPGKPDPTPPTDPGDTPQIPPGKPEPKPGQHQPGGHPTPHRPHGSGGAHSPTHSGRAHNPKTHVVRGTETLWFLADCYGVSMQQLYWANRDTIGSSPDLIRPGQKLVIPSKSLKVPAFDYTPKISAGYHVAVSCPTDSPKAQQGNCKK
jgi:LysM repeat protein